MNKFFKKAFTLIELLVVIAIIGILSGLIVVTMGGVTQKANIAKSQVFSNSLRNALMANLVSEWKFDGTTADGSSATTNDVLDTWSGGNNGSLSATPPTVRTGSNCISGSCLQFDGSSNYVYVSGSDSSTSNLAITGAITLSAWAKFNANGVSQVICGRGLPGASNGNYGYSLWKYASNNQIYFSIYSTTTMSENSSNFAVTDSGWHYIVATWDGTTNANGEKIYIDTSLKNSWASTISAIGQPSYQFRIGVDGRSTPLSPFNGSIDEVRIYNAAVPISQIKEEYYTGLNGLLFNNSISKEEYDQRINQLSINN